MCTLLHCFPARAEGHCPQHVALWFSDQSVAAQHADDHLSVWSFCHLDDAVASLQWLHHCDLLLLKAATSGFLLQAGDGSVHLLQFEYGRLPEVVHHVSMMDRHVMQGE